MNTKSYNLLKVQGEKYYNELTLFTVISSLRNTNILTKNKKLSKSLQTFGLFLVPFDFLKEVNGKENCSKIAKLCINSCIAFTGIIEMLNSRNDLLSNAMKKKIRLQWLLDFYPILFELLLKDEILREESKLSKQGIEIKIRLNGTSDINWTNFIQSMTRIQFYDYTKDYNRMPLENYQLTYSYSGVSSQWVKMQELLRLGQNVAVVFHVSKNSPLPTTFNGFEVINGDLSDDRTLDDRGVIVGLKMKIARGGGRSLLTVNN